MTNDAEFDALLEAWADEVRAALDIDAAVDVKAVLGLAGVAAHAVVRPAAPLTTYLVGFAAGRAAGRGDDPAAAAAAATRVARELADRRSRAIRDASPGPRHVPAPPSRADRSAQRPSPSTTRSGGCSPVTSPRRSTCRTTPRRRWMAGPCRARDRGGCDRPGR